MNSTYSYKYGHNYNYAIDFFLPEGTRDKFDYFVDNIIIYSLMINRNVWISWNYSEVASNFMIVVFIFFLEIIRTMKSLIHTLKKTHIRKLDPKLVFFSKLSTKKKGKKTLTNFHQSYGLAANGSSRSDSVNS